MPAGTQRVVASSRVRTTKPRASRPSRASYTALVDRHGEITLELMGVDEEDGGEGDAGSFYYFLKAKDNKVATKWVNNVKLRMQYYDKLDSAGQSEIAEIFHEEEVRVGRGAGGGEQCGAMRMA